MLLDPGLRRSVCLKDELPVAVALQGLAQATLEPNTTHHHHSVNLTAHLKATFVWREQRSGKQRSGKGRKGKRGGGFESGCTDYPTLAQWGKECGAAAGVCFTSPRVPPYSLSYFEPVYHS